MRIKAVPKEGVVADDDEDTQSSNDEGDRPHSINHRHQERSVI